VKLSENPIFLTHKRLVHRGGVLAAVVIATLIGFSLLLGLFSSLSELHQSRWGFRSPAETGKIFYGWVIGVEIFMLVLLGANRVTRALQEDRKAGLWDSNRLTPLKPEQIVAGYWLAPALREFYMAVVLAGFGLLVVLFSHLPITLWLGTQTLIFSTALFCGLLGFLFGMAAQKSSGALIFLAMFFFIPFSFVAPSRVLTNFLFPIYGIGNLFQIGEVERDWARMPELFGQPMPAILISLGLQAIIGWFIWRVLVRKTANPFQPLLLRWEAISIFSIMVFAQHALIWKVRTDWFRADVSEQLLAITHGGTLLIGLALLLLASRPPEQIRVEAMRLGLKSISDIFQRSSVSLALALGGVAAVAMTVQFSMHLLENFSGLIVTVVNLLMIFLTFTLLLEFCRLRHQRRALGFVALWLFVLVVVPLILGAVFASEETAQVCLLAPGFLALTSVSAEKLPALHLANLVHFAVVVFLFIDWRRQWKKLLARAA
jgi:hypothetical protein